jgi:hypothetical protein
MVQRRSMSSHRLALLISSLLLSLMPAHSAPVTIEGDAPRENVTVAIKSASVADVVRELSRKYAFHVQGLDGLNTAALSATLSGSLRDVLETLLRNCNYMLIRSGDKESGIDRLIILDCGQPSGGSDDGGKKRLFYTSQEPVPVRAVTDVKFKAAKEKAKVSGVHTLTQKDIEGLTPEQIKKLRGY